MMNSEEAFKNWASQQLKDHGQIYSDLVKAIWKNGYVRGAIDAAQEPDNEK